ncbi:hypothetical protein P3389_31440, partial [Vibrio parahaemolyticus]|nr:hypothetical protein [Vibrio parahaemolyticus]
MAKTRNLTQETRLKIKILSQEGCSCRQKARMLAGCQQLRTAIEEEWTNNQQPDQLYAKEMCCTA